MSTHVYCKDTQRTRRRALVLAGLAALLPIVLGLSACETLRVGSDYDRAANLSTYKSFTWVPREDYGTRNPLVVERARDAIKAGLEQKGYTYVTDESAADFTVDFTIGARDRLDVHTYPVTYAGPWWSYGPGWWGYRYWGSGVDVHQYREGVLAIDVFDAKTHKPVWHGWAKKSLTQDNMDHSSGAIHEAAAAVLAKFPPG